MKQVNKVIAALLSMALLLSLSLSVGRTHARYLRGITWQSVYAPVVPKVTSDRLAEGGETVLCRDWTVSETEKERAYKINIFSTVEGITGEIHCVSNSPYVQVGMSSNNLELGTEGTTISLWMTLTEQAYEMNYLEDVVIRVGMLTEGEYEAELWADYTLKLYPGRTSEETEPTEPEPTVNPTEPTQGENTETTDPTEGTEATDPTEGTETTEPIEGTEATDPTQNTEVTDPTESTETTNPTEATGVAQETTAAAEVTSAENNIQVTGLEVDNQPQETTKPVETEPQETIQPTETEPQETIQPTETEPQETTKPVETEPQETTKPVETEPQETTKPVETEPQETTQPTETEPQETTQPTETEPKEDSTTGDTEIDETHPMLKSDTGEFNWTEWLTIPITAPAGTDYVELLYNGSGFPEGTRYIRPNGDDVLFGDKMRILLSATGGEELFVQLNFANIAETDKVSAMHITVTASTIARTSFVTESVTYEATRVEMQTLFNDVQSYVIAHDGSLSVPIQWNGEDSQWYVERLICGENGELTYIRDESQFGLTFELMTQEDETGIVQTVAVLSNSEGAAPAGSYRLVLQRMEDDTFITSAQLPFFIHYKALDMVLDP